MKSSPIIFGLGLLGAAATFAFREQLAATFREQAAPAAAPAIAVPIADRITAIGRLQPKDGVIQVAAPSQRQASVVLEQLLVDVGSRVHAGEVIATLDTRKLRQVIVDRMRLELEHAVAEAQRQETLHENKIVSTMERDTWRLKANTLRGHLQQAEVELELASVRAPIDGRVLAVFSRAGERVGPEGIVEIGNTDAMYAVAEIYETDIGRVRPGQRATITSPVIGEPALGTVERLGIKIGKLATLDLDPMAKTDARIVPVDIRLDDSTRVAGLTNLQVEIAIEP